MDKFHEIRQMYPALKNQAYLDTPTTGLISNATYEAIKSKLDKRYYEGLNIDEYWDEWNQAEKVREKVADMINASADEIFFGKDSSDMINAFVANIKIPKGSNVIIPDISFPSTRNSWLNRKCDGLEVRFIPNNAGIVTTEEIISNIDNETFAISVCAVEPSSGYYYDLELLGKACKDNNIYFIVDCTQGLGVLKFDVCKMDIDVMVSSTYKWMTNVFGLGIGYMKRDIIKNILPSHVGWTGTRDRIKDFNNLELTINDGARRFETGGLNWLGIAGVEETIKTYMNLGKDEIENHVFKLIQFLYDQMSAVKHFRINPNLAIKNRSGIVYIEMDDDVSISEKEFSQKGIRVHVSGNKIRVGVHYYNDLADVKKLLAILKEV